MVKSWLNPYGVLMNIHDPVLVSVQDVFLISRPILNNGAIDIRIVEKIFAARPGPVEAARRRPDTSTERAQSTPDFVQVGRDTGGGHTSIVGSPCGGRAALPTSVQILKPIMV